MSIEIATTVYELRLAAASWKKLWAPDGWCAVYADLARRPGEPLRLFDKRLGEAEAKGHFRWRDRNNGWGEVRV